MVNIENYKTITDYPDANGIYKILYPLKDAIVINPFLVTLFGLLFVLTISSYFTYLNLTGRSKFFICLLASSFSTFIISVFFAMGELISPFSPLLFIGITIISLTLTIFYK